MWIDTKIPFEPKQQLAMAYNRAMKTSKAEWVLLLDQDVFLCNPHWYDICLKAIEELKNINVGLISCMTSGIKQKRIQKVDTSIGDNMRDHIDLSYDCYKKYGSATEQIHVPITGFFMLVKKSVWEKVKFVHQQKGVNNIDTDFSTRLLEQGYSIYLLTGLYVYHMRGLRKLEW